MEKTMKICGNATSDQQENTLEIEQFFQDNYLFRRNVLSGKVEFATLPADEPVYRVLTQPTGIEQHHHPSQARGCR